MAKTSKAKADNTVGDTAPFRVGDRVQIPVHYDVWMRGARYGTVMGFRKGGDGLSDFALVKMDHPGIRKQVRLWKGDWDYIGTAPDTNHAA